MGCCNTKRKKVVHRGKQSRNFSVMHNPSYFKIKTSIRRKAKPPQLTLLKSNSNGQQLMLIVKHTRKDFKPGRLLAR